MDAHGASGVAASRVPYCSKCLARHSWGTPRCMYGYSALLQTNLYSSMCMGTFFVTAIVAIIHFHKSPHHIISACLALHQRRLLSLSYVIPHMARPTAVPVIVDDVPLYCDHEARSSLYRSLSPEQNLQNTCLPYNPSISRLPNMVTEFILYHENLALRGTDQTTGHDQLDSIANHCAAWSRVIHFDGAHVEAAPSSHRIPQID
ncbi:hypothetical protein EDB89DRAFT_1175733 [Lactarius sanguifluus]|nr:hypothetical protein EDB89DRAFT_1175733 [Lactarius sanguifluus]